MSKHRRRPYSSPGDENLSRSSGAVAGLAALGVLSGFAIDVTLAAVFGAGLGTDAYFIAATIPFALMSLLLGSANRSLVPLISTWIGEEGREAARIRTGRVLGTAISLAAVVAAVGIALAPVLPRIIAPASSPETKALAATLTAVLFLAPVFRAGSEVLRALLNADYHFYPAALTPVVGNLTALGVFIFLYRRLGVVAVALGYVVGGFAQLSFLLAVSAGLGLAVRPRWSPSDPDVRQAGRLVALPAANSGLVLLARTAERFLASFLGPGAISILQYGLRVVNALGGSVFFRSVVVLLLPRLARSREDPEASGRVLSNGVRILTAISIPLSAFLAVLAQPIAAALFQRGAFTAESSARLASLLSILAVVFMFDALTRVLMAYFLARLDVVTPFINGAIIVAANVALAVALFEPLGLWGLALAFVLAQMIGFVNATSLILKRITIGIRPLAAHTAKILFAAGVGAATAKLLHDYLVFDGLPVLWRVSFLGVAMAAGGLVMLASMRLTRVFPIERVDS